MSDSAYNLDRQVAQSILADHRDRLLPPIDTEPAAPIYPGDRGDQLFEEILIQDYVKVGFEATEADDVFTATDHGLEVGDVIVLLNPAGGPAGFPGGLTQTAAPDSLHKYAVYTVPDADTFTIEEIGGGAAVDVTADGDGYFVLLINGRLMNAGVRQEYDQLADEPDWVDRDDVWVFDDNDEELPVGKRMPARRHGDAGPGDDRRVLYTTFKFCCEADDGGGGGGGGGATPCCAEIDNIPGNLTLTFTQNLTGSITLTKRNVYDADFYAINYIGFCVPTDSIFVWDGDKVTAGGNHLVSAALVCCSDYGSINLGVIFHFEYANGGSWPLAYGSLIPSKLSGYNFIYEHPAATVNTNNECTEFFGHHNTLDQWPYMVESTDIEFTIA